MSVQLFLRQGTAAQWTAANPILAAGEFGYESDTQKLKVGDGSTTWNFLSYNTVPVGYIQDTAITSKGQIITGSATSNYSVLPIPVNPDIDRVFAANIGAGGGGAEVSVVADQPDGKVLVGGSFTTWNGVSANGIVRLNKDGTRDTVFSTNIGSGPSGSSFMQILAIFVKKDGKILVGGTFDSWNGSSVSCLVQLNSDGTRDTNFNVNYGGSFDFVSSIDVTENGNIVLGGSFSEWNYQPTGNIVRLGPGGETDYAFLSNIGSGASGTVRKLKIQSDQKIVLVGNFDTWNSTTVNNIVRLNADGTIDTAFTANTGTAGDAPFEQIYSLVIQQDGKIVVGGYISSWNSTSASNIVRLNSDGTLDTTFATNVGVGASSSVDALAVDADGKILVGGNFYEWAGVTVNYLVRLNTNGTRDTAFTTAIGTAGNSAVFAIDVLPNGSIVLGGAFSSWNGFTVGGLIELRPYTGTVILLENVSANVLYYDTLALTSLSDVDIVSASSNDLFARGSSTWGASPLRSAFSVNSFARDLIATRVDSAGYFSRGVSTTTVYKWTFPADAVTTTTAAPATMDSHAGFANPSVAGYFSRGVSTTTVYKWAFPADTVTTTTAAPATMSLHAGFANSSIAGYFSRAGTTTVYKWTFPADTVSTATAVPATTSDNAGFANPSVAGYLARGAFTATIYKYAFPADTVSATTDSLVTQYSNAGFSNPFVSGYFSAGNTPSPTSVHKWAFPTETVSTATAAPANMARHAGFANPAVGGYFSKGIDGSFNASSIVYKWSFPTDAVTTTTFAPQASQYNAGFANA